MTISKDTRQTVFERDGFKCRYCGKKLTEKTAQIEHIEPRSRGGTDDISNLATSCMTRNFLKSEKLVDLVTVPLSRQIANTWISAYLRSPVWTLAATLLTAVSLGFGIFFYERHDRAEREAARGRDMDFNAQIEHLDQTEKSIRQLLSFVSDQRERIEHSEAAIDALKEEHEKLQPLVNTDREVVEALFRTQEERARASVVRERWIGFGLGVLASIMASTIIIVVRYLVLRKRDAQQ